MNDTYVGRPSGHPSDNIAPCLAIAEAEAGRNAVFATMPARGGIAGPAPIFEGRRGVFQLVSGRAEVDVAVLGGRGGQFKIHQCGVKSCPAVVYGQTAVIAGIAVAKEARGDVDRITAVLDDGRRIVRQVDDIAGFGRQPTPRADMERKLRGTITPEICSLGMASRPGPRCPDLDGAIA